MCFLQCTRCEIANVRILIVFLLVQHRNYLLLNKFVTLCRCVERGGEDFQRFSNIEPDIRNWITSEEEERTDDLGTNNLQVQRWRDRLLRPLVCPTRLTKGNTYCYGLDSGHSEQIIRMLPHSHDLRNYGNFRPFNTKDFCKLFQVHGGSLSYAENRISKPRHA